jgi:hypothetical protein
MRHPEQKVWDTLKRRMPEDFIPQRHEDKYSAGIPDLSFVWRGVSGWIELKNATPSFEVRPAQLAWMTKRSKAGAICILLARYNNMWAACRIQDGVQLENLTTFKSLGDPVGDPVILLHSLVF